MTPPEDQVRIRHLRDAVEKALRYTQGSSRQGHEILRLAVTKLVEIVGEAAKQVSEPTRNAHPSVPWSAAARMVLGVPRGDQLSNSTGGSSPTRP
jgi:uncharacterized protein with HEPN domain